jgi:cellulose synthase/poly-beta-1,6-N-acetylglucosamine synthase-like glycosyltransferase
MQMIDFFRPSISKMLSRTNRTFWKLVYREKPPQLRENPSISFCTGCMGRTHHLRETLVKNIEDNKDYPNVDFVLLNYNSFDDMDEWAQKNLDGFIASGKVKYYKANNATYYNYSHSKNISHKLARGEIVCNLDADNFTGKGFARLLASIFKKNSGCVVRPNWSIGRGTCGRIATLKKYFMLAGGYDERLAGWGHEDVDFVVRLSHRFWLDEVIIDDKSFFVSIQHDLEKGTKFCPPHLRNHKLTQKANRRISQLGALIGSFKANTGLHWGKTRVIKNFGEQIIEI